MIVLQAGLKNVTQNNDKFVNHNLFSIKCNNLNNEEFLIIDYHGMSKITIKMTNLINLFKINEKILYLYSGGEHTMYKKNFETNQYEITVNVETSTFKTSDKNAQIWQFKVLNRNKIFVY